MNGAATLQSALYAGQTGILELRSFAREDADEQERQAARDLRDFVEVRDGKFDVVRVERYLRGCEIAKLGAFYGVALRTKSAASEHKGDIEHCQVLTALFVDADFKNTSEATVRARLAEFPKSSADTNSGGGLHPYWFLRDPLFLRTSDDLAMAKSALQRLAAQFKDIVDVSVSEPARVLRVPGALNYKYRPARPVVLEHCDPALRYSLAELLSLLPADTPAAAEIGQFSMPDKVAAGDRHGMMFRLLRSQKARGVSLDAALACCQIENKAKCDPAISQDELDRYLRRCWNEADRPGFAPPPPDAAGIVMRGGELTAIVDRAESALLSLPIYQRGGFLARTIRLDLAIGDGPDDVRREAGSTVITDVCEPWLVEQMGRVLPWYSENAEGTRTRRDPKPIYARTLLGRREWRFPVLRGVVTAPTLACDGRIIATPGFDAESGLVVDVAPGAFPPVPANPTKDDAARALARLVEPLRGFPFVDDAARSVALSALLTALVRVHFASAPLHGFDAPTAGTGKSLLAEMAGLLATGVRPPALSQGKTEDEDEKRLSTVLFAGDPVIHLDNCERPIAGDFLCSMLTQETVQARILGLSKRQVLPSTALVLASGNNLTFAGDTTRRVVCCRLDAKVERPDTRAFDFDCHAEVLAARPELVVAGLTILRAYHVAGRPERLTPMGTYDEWGWIRGALVWLGHADPADTRLSILDNDPRKDELGAVMDLWEKAFGPEGVETTDIARLSDVGFDTPTHDTAELAAMREHATRVAALRDKLVEVACRGAWNGKAVGWWLRRNKDRVLGGRYLRCETVGGHLQWRLEGGEPAGEKRTQNGFPCSSGFSAKRSVN